MELARARDYVMLLTDDRKTLMEALETAPIEDLSALKAIGEQFAPSAETIPQCPTAEKAAVLDEATREHRKVAGGFIGHVLSTVSASIRQREELVPDAAGDPELHVQAHGLSLVADLSSVALVSR